MPIVTLPRTDTLDQPADAALVHQPGAPPDRAVAGVLGAAHRLRALILRHLGLQLGLADPLVLGHPEVATERRGGSHDQRGDKSQPHARAAYPVGRIGQHSRMNPIQQLTIWLQEAHASGVEQPRRLCLATSIPTALPRRGWCCCAAGRQGLCLLHQLPQPQGPGPGRPPRAALTFHWDAAGPPGAGRGPGVGVSDSESTPTSPPGPALAVAAWASDQSAVIPSGSTCCSAYGPRGRWPSLTAGGTAAALARLPGGGQADRVSGNTAPIDCTTASCTGSRVGSGWWSGWRRDGGRPR
jgi:hypothetical protein